MTTERAMKITKVMANLCDEHPILAYANIVFDDEFIVRGIRILVKRDGSRLMLMPSRQNKVGEWHDVAHPLTPACRSRIEGVVMSQVDAMLQQTKPNDETAAAGKETPANQPV